MAQKNATILLKENKIKLTKKRKGIMNVLETAKTPLSPAEIFLQIKQFLPKANLTTVYRNLELLEQKGLVKQFSFNKSSFYYELVSGRPHHHHLICTRCGRVEDSRILNEEFIDEVVKSSKFKIEDHRFEFFGLCRPCQGEAL